MFLKRNNKGFGHVEAVLTLVIFIAFIVFAFVFFNPFRTSRTLSSTLDYAWREVTGYSNEVVESYSVFFNPTAPLIVALAIPGAPQKNATVLDISGNIIPSFNNQIGVNFNKPSDNFAVIQYSNNFSAGNSIVGALAIQSDYSISSSDSSEIIFEDHLLFLNLTYYSNYTGLKKQFNLPNRVDFGFLVVFSDGSKIESLKEIPSGFEIQAKRDRVQVVRSSGKIEYAEVIVQVW